MFFELALAAYLIDLVIGELPCKHPVVLMGEFIQGYEQRFYRDNILAGGVLVFSLLLLTLLLSLVLVYLIQLLPSYLAFMLLAICASTGLAMNMLYHSVAGIITAEQPRLALSYLVSRDTEQMTDTDIYKAALETWAENLSDGVIAPLFYLVLFGLPGIAIYKAINTLDSMIAYKTPRYFYFGKVAAYLDDMANYIPARLTGLLIVLVSNHKQRAWQSMCQDGHKLDSPNAGFPIAAMAGALGIALAGNAIYHGQLKHKAILGKAVYSVNIESLKQALAIKMPLNLVIVCLLMLGIVYKYGY